MRRLARIVIALALLVPLAPTAARAGDGYWSPSGCQPPPPIAVQWWGVPGSGSWYSSERGTFWVGGDFYHWFKADLWECGRLLGVPLGDAFDLHTRSPLYRPGEWLIQDFWYGRLMRHWSGNWYIYRWSDGYVFSLGPVQ